jgi:hypothetical protein
MDQQFSLNLAAKIIYVKKYKMYVLLIYVLAQIRDEKNF